MNRRAAGPIIAGLALNGCHPPDQAIYDESKKCVGIFDVASQQIRPDQLRRAGLFSDDVDRQALETYEGALQSGAKLGLANVAVSKDVDQAKKAAWATYGQSSGSQSTATSAKLINAVKQCMPKPEGPND
jgi:hypothetical protein